MSFRAAYHRSTSHIYCMHIWIELLADWCGHHTNPTFHKLDYYQCVRQVQSTFCDGTTWFGRGVRFIRFESHWTDWLDQYWLLCDDHGKMSRYQRVSFFFIPRMRFVRFAHIKCPFFYYKVFLRFESNFACNKRKNSNKSKFRISSTTRTHIDVIYNL